MAIVSGKITINDILYLEVDSDPSTGLGTDAPIGSHANANDGSGEYYKFGLGNTDWQLQGGPGATGATGATGSPATPGTAAQGEIYFDDNVTTQTLTLQNTYYKITPTAWVAGTNNGFTPIIPSQEIQCGVAGTYLVVAQGDIQAANNEVIEFAIYVNGIHQNNLESYLTGRGGSQHLTFGCNGFLVLVPTDIVDLRVKCSSSAGQVILVTHCNLSLQASAGATGATGATGSGGLISVTYAQLTALIGANGLVTGQEYLLTDFATRHEIPNVSPVVVNTGTTEPLIIKANSVNTIYANAISTLFPKDELLYEVVDTSTAGGNKGRIYYRKDTIKNNSTWYDWRVVLFRRWETFAASGVFAVMLDNGEAFQDLFTFNNSATASGCYSNSIGSIGDIASFPNQLNNIVFNCVAKNNTFGKDCANCNFITFFGAECFNNVFGDTFSSNYVYGACGYNQFGQQCNQNTFNGDVNYNNIGAFFSTNTIALIFSNNVIDDSFYFNSISSDFIGNKIGGNCQLNSFGGNASFNIIGSNFISNTLNSNFDQNIISDGFSGNDLGSFVSNTVDSTFNGNTVTGACNFHYNSIGDSFSGNFITGNSEFQFNKIGTNCNTNSFDVTTLPFEYNSVGDSFSSNTLSGTFQRNTISSSFTGNVCNGVFTYNFIGVGMNANTIGSGFSNNTVGNSFSTNNIGIDCQDNSFGNNNQSLILNDNFNNNNISHDFVSVDLSTATLVYSITPKYTKNILRMNDGIFILSYIDSGTISMQFATPNS